MSSLRAIAHYRITSKLGEGGMGVVYRATDTKLKRDVAIKVLPDCFAADPDRLARFTREAQVLASLNHPNIAAIYGVEERALVMELVEGAAPAGPMSAEKALPIAHQLIDALEYAHDRGIVHRDLKPSNLRLTSDGRLKVLDFGLAKALVSDAPTADPAASPTVTMRDTAAGVIVGTAAYLSPEQARGQKVDRRADIWAFGVVIYELLAGQPLFDAETVSDTLAAVLRQDVDFGAVPPRFERLLRACLARDPKRRLGEIGDARFLLEEPAPVAAARRRPLRSIAAAVAAGALVPGALLWRATRPVALAPVELNVDFGESAAAGFRGPVAVSRDGGRIAYPARLPSGRQGLAVRALSQSNPTLLPGTEDGSNPVFSPDGQWLAFIAGNKLQKVSVLGGAPIALAEAPSPRGIDWGDDGYVYAALNNSTGISRVPENGGAPAAVTTLRADEASHRWPQAVPGSRAIFFTSDRILTDWNAANVEALSLATHERSVLARGGYFGRYLPTGHLLYAHDGSVFAAKLDLNRLRLTSPPAVVIPGVAARRSTGDGQFAFSDTGLLVYTAGSSELPRYPFGWMRQGGKLEALPVPEDLYAVPRLSPDGTRLAVTKMSTEDVWTYDFARGVFARVTSTGEGNWYPVWAPDGRHLVYSSNVREAHVILWARADGSAPPIRLIERKEYINPLSFRPDGRALIYTRGGGIDVATVDLSDPEQPKVTNAEVWLREGSDAMFSPDGRWIAYAANESGRLEVYVRPAPRDGRSAAGRWAVSSGGGRFPVWARSGRQLFYVAPENVVTVADYTASDDTFSPGKPRRWSDSPIAGGLNPSFDVAPDGNRIVAFPAPPEPSDARSRLHLTFVFHFFDELKRRAP